MEHLQKVEAEFVKHGVVPGGRVKLSDEPPARVNVPRQATACEPRIELVRDGDVVQAIDVTCTCGQRIRLKCLYS